MSKPRLEWRDHFIRQFSVAISLLITLGVAALGFSANLLRDEHFRLLLSVERKSMFTWGLLFLSASIGCGVLALFLRVIRTRLTFMNVYRSNDNSNADMIGLESKMDPIAWIMHSLLFGQAALFSLSVWKIVHTIWVVYDLSLNLPLCG